MRGSSPRRRRCCVAIRPRGWSVSAAGRSSLDFAKMIGALGLADRVRLAGFRDDLPQLIPGLDVLAHPAEREGLGVALLEAASCAVPVVACAAGGMPDVVEHERTGLLVAPTNGAALGAALDRLIGSAAERARLGAAARERVACTFSVAALATAHRELYCAVLGAREQRARRRPRPITEERFQ